MKNENTNKKLKMNDKEIVNKVKDDIGNLPSVMSNEGKQLIIRQIYEAIDLARIDESKKFTKITNDDLGKLLLDRFNIESVPSSVITLKGLIDYISQLTSE